MSAYPEYHEAFAPLTWATPFLDHPDWRVYPRRRSLKTRAPDESYDRYCSVTLRSDDGIQQWAELQQKPAPGSIVVPKTISLFKYGPAFTGYQTICHGGAVMSMMDEAFGNMMIAAQREAAGLDEKAWAELTDNTWDRPLGEGQTLKNAMKGAYVTAQINFSFLKPVLSPGVVGVECTMIEHKGHKMRLAAVMKDGQGTPLVKAESLWIQLGQRVKL
ncbi:hypothetical protein N0V90_005659 [Kalmusia sp. IMI 367209]|nr:hypothetical protein N0V90_005659 [Kalmusia sp. IMI 367209]